MKTYERRKGVQGRKKKNKIGHSSIIFNSPNPHTTRVNKPVKDH